MIKIEKTHTSGWGTAIRGMRNPMNSWDKSDSYTIGTPNGLEYCIGSEDLKLMMNLRNAGPEHAKYLRMINVTCDITAPLYWWKEFDTYKVGTVANSCSTMHKIMAKPFTTDDFSCEHLIVFSEACELMSELDMNIGDDESLNLDVDPFKNNGNLWSPAFLLIKTIDALNQYRNLYIKVKDTPTKDLVKRNDNLKTIWWQIIQLLPSSYNQKRTIQMNYAVLANIYCQRTGHKLDEWRIGFLNWIRALPYNQLIIGEGDTKDAMVD